MSTNMKTSEYARVATHSRIFAWRIPWTEDPRGLQSRVAKTLRPKRLSMHARTLAAVNWYNHFRKLSGRIYTHILSPGSFTPRCIPNREAHSYTPKDTSKNVTTAASPISPSRNKWMSVTVADITGVTWINELWYICAMADHPGMQMGEVLTCNTMWVNFTKSFCWKWRSGEEPTCLCSRPGFSPWVGKIPWRRAWLPTPVFLPGDSAWVEEPGGLQSLGLQSQTGLSACEHTHTHARARAHTHTHTHASQNSATPGRGR